MNEVDIRRALREWVQQRAGAGAPAITDTTPLIASRLITSLHVMDLILFLEELRQDAIDPAMLRPGTFRDIDAIYGSFFSPATHDEGP